MLLSSPLQAHGTTPHLSITQFYATRPRRPRRKRQLHNALVRLARANHPGMRPHRHAAPLPLLHHLRVDLLYHCAHARQSSSSIMRDSISFAAAASPCPALSVLFILLIVVNVKTSQRITYFYNTPLRRALHMQNSVSPPATKHGHRVKVSIRQQHLLRHTPLWPPALKHHSLLHSATASCAYPGHNSGHAHNQGPS